MPFSIKTLFKKIKDNYVRNWKEQDDFQRYGGILFFAVVMGCILFAPEKIQQVVLKYLNVLTTLFLVIMFRRVRRNKRELMEKHKEIEGQKQLIEEKQKEILASIHYAKRIQTSLLPTDKYINRNLQRLNKN